MREAFDDALVSGWQELNAACPCPTRTTGTCSRRQSGAARRPSSPPNAKDVPAAALAPLGLEAVHPDDFLLDQLDLSPPTILQVIREQAASAPTDRILCPYPVMHADNAAGESLRPAARCQHCLHGLLGVVNGGDFPAASGEDQQRSEVEGEVTLYVYGTPD